MKVILTKDVDSLGAMGSIVRVKDGYARNYLIPRSFAVVANDSNRKELEHHQREIAAKREKLISEMKSLAQKIEKLRVVVQKQTGEEDRIFGSVTTAEIADFLEQKGFQVSKKSISFKDEIKKTGIYSADIQLHSEVKTTIKVKVEAAPKE